MSFDQQVQLKALDLVQLNIEICNSAGAGHPSTGASLADLLTVLCYRVMRWNPKEPDSRFSDRLVLSEGHACPIVYAIAADLGVTLLDNGKSRAMTVDDAHTLRALTSPIDGHPNPAVGFPFWAAATGSLGQGLSVALGYAAAAKLDGISRRIFCFIGDGESREGQIWEALDFMVDHGLVSVCPVFNCNQWGQASPVSYQQSAERLVEKLESYGLQTALIDGHNPSAILHAYEQHAKSMRNGQAFAIVARTIKMYGVPSLYQTNLHGKPIPDVESAVNEIHDIKKSIGRCDPIAFTSPSPDATSPEISFDTVPLVKSFKTLCENEGEQNLTKISTRNG
ncbi:hypothetical protein P9112_002307 [Eukaryota sp. TZLM1-RC]